MVNNAKWAVRLVNIPPRRCLHDPSLWEDRTWVAANLMTVGFYTQSSVSKTAACLVRIPASLLKKQSSPFEDGCFAPSTCEFPVDMYLALDHQRCWWGLQQWVCAPPAHSVPPVPNTENTTAEQTPQDKNKSKDKTKSTVLWSKVSKEVGTLDVPWSLPR